MLVSFIGVVLQQLLNFSLLLGVVIAVAIEVKVSLVELIGRDNLDNVVQIC